MPTNGSTEHLQTFEGQVTVLGRELCGSQVKSTDLMWQCYGAPGRVFTLMMERDAFFARDVKEIGYLRAPEVAYDALYRFGTTTKLQAIARRLH